MLDQAIAEATKTQDLEPASRSKVGVHLCFQMEILAWKQDSQTDCIAPSRSGETVRGARSHAINGGRAIMHPQRKVVHNAESQPSTALDPVDSEA